MKHKLLIWSKNKKTGSFFIDSHVEVSQEEIEQWVMEKYANDYTLDDRREYHAELEETII